MKSALPLQEVVAQLTAHYGRPRPAISKDPFELILLENVAYLVSDERREAAFKLLRKQAGTKPYEILTAANENLLTATRLGGMHPEQRVSRLREIALIAVNEFDGNLKAALKLPLPKAKQALRKFPGIGEPGAERSFCLRAPTRCWGLIPTACEFCCGWALVKRKKELQRDVSVSSGSDKGSTKHGLRLAD